MKKIRYTGPSRRQEQRRKARRRAAWKGRSAGLGKSVRVWWDETRRYPAPPPRPWNPLIINIAAYV